MPAASSLVSRLGAAAASLFYQLERADRAGDGSRPGAPAAVPAGGPLLVVANHPNSLLDPALVTLAVGRPARFLAKAPLFTDRKVGWLVRASGAIPVHRAQDAAADDGARDEAARAARRAANAETFGAAEDALLAGDAIALFPEGISHARPGLAPLKTGAARLALGAAARLGRAFPLVPVGITLDDRAIFRSRGLLVTGAPLAWDDLADAAIAAARAGDAPTRPDLVHALTARIADGLGAVTASFATWEDARLVALADAVWSAERDAARAEDPAGAGALDRRRLGADALARLRALPADAPARREADALAADLRAHARLLRALRLSPADLGAATDAGTAVSWAARRVPLLLLGALAAVGTAIGWLPYRLTGRIADVFPGAEESDVRATAKALVGALLFLGWTVALTLAAGLAGGWPAALATLVGVPPLLLLALVTAEGWRDAARDARRFLVLRGRRARVAELRARQRALAARVGALVAAIGADAP